LHGLHLLFAVAAFLAHLAAFRAGSVFLVQHPGALLLDQGLKTGAEKFTFGFREQLAQFHYRGRFAVLKDLIYDKINPFVDFVVNHVSKFILWILIKNICRESHAAPLCQTRQFLTEAGQNGVDVNSGHLIS
jgi:hypothetical protein